MTKNKLKPLKALIKEEKKHNIEFVLSNNLPNLNYLAEQEQDNDLNKDKKKSTLDKTKECQTREKENITIEFIQQENFVNIQKNYIFFLPNFPEMDKSK